MTASAEILSLLSTHRRRAWAYDYPMGLYDLVMYAAVGSFVGCIFLARRQAVLLGEIQLVLAETRAARTDVAALRKEIQLDMAAAAKVISNRVQEAIIDAELGL